MPNTVGRSESAARDSVYVPRCRPNNIDRYSMVPVRCFMWVRRAAFALGQKFRSDLDGRKILSIQGIRQSGLTRFFIANRPSDELKEKLGRLLVRQIASVVFALAATGASFAFAQIDGTYNRRYPNVIDVKVRPRSADRFDFDVTISSPYDSPQRYADAFRVMSADGKVHGERKLLHDHANEQPFTRDLYDVLIPPAVRFVVVEARDQKYGYGGRSVRITLPGR